MENEVHFSFGSILVGDDFLAVAEDGGLEFYRAGLVGAVNVAEGRGEHETSDGIEGLVDLHHVFRRGVKLLGGEAGGIVTVFFATDAAGFNFEDDVELNALLEEFDGDLHVLIKFHDRAIEHVRLEKRAFAFGDALAGGIEKRAEEGVNLLGVAVIGVEADEDVVFLSEGVDGFGEDDGTESGVIDGGAGSELATTGRDLDDTVGLCLSESFEGAAGGGEGSDVDGGVGISTLLGGIEHLLILFWCCNWHAGAELP